jgi:hypothetical protein
MRRLRSHAVRKSHTEPDRDVTLPAVPVVGESWAPLFLRRFVSWSLSAAATAAALALVTDFTRLVLAHAGLVNAIGAAINGAAVGILIGYVAGLYLGLLGALSRRAAKSWPRLKLLWPIVAAAPMGTAAWGITHAPHVVALRGAMVLVLSGLGVLFTWAAHRPLKRVARLATLIAGGLALLTDVWASRWHYREVHDLLQLVTLSSAVALATPIRRAVAWLPRSRLVLLVAGGLAFSAATVWLVDPLIPGWRPAAADGGLYGPALTRAARWLTDFDGDGFSALAWGGDCDDFDASRNPFARDAHGHHDANCNGIDPPEHPSDADRGLAPASGDPALAPEVPLVLLITMDSVRAEVLRPEAMPQLSAAATEALVLRKTYSAGTRTIVSLPWLQRGWRDGAALAGRATAAGVRTALVFGANVPAVLAQVREGFEEVLVPQEPRWDAHTVTELALARIARRAPDERLYLWAHYFDAHTPYPTARVGNAPAELPESYAHYLAGVQEMDAEIARLLAQLRATGLLAQSVVLLTSDHGEGFGEHGVLFHAVAAYEELVRVPALLFAPGLAPGNTHLLASHSDVQPTLLGALGLLQPEDELFGRSWLRLRGGSAGPLHTFVAVRTAHAVSGGNVVSPMMAIVTPRYKAVRILEDNLLEIYDLAADPGEEHNVSWVDPPLARRLHRMLSLYRDLDGFPDAFDRSELQNFRGRFVHSSE